MLRAFRAMAATAALAALLPAVPAGAALKWEGCADPSASEFQAADIATRSRDGVEEPMKMAFDLVAGPGEDAAGKVDVYFTERLGRIRRFDSRAGTVITLATLPLNIDPANSSDGVMGIALDPGFKSNRLIYVYYTYVSAAEKSWRVSRFALNEGHTSLDPASEVPVIKIPIRSGSKHPGGAIQFDAYGDLWIATGNDYRSGNDYPLYSSPNTNDLRGKILRIRPTPQGGYAIPEGNLFGSGEAGTRPEVYIMGARNPYTLSLDPVRRWALWGDIGPDFENFNGDPINASGSPEKTEEFNLSKSPGNYGYPFFSGDLATVPGTDPDAPAIPAAYDWEGADPGLRSLPKAVPPIHAYRKSCAVSGPLYRYDGDLNSSVKFPPHFHRKWLVTDFNGDNNKLTAFTLNDAGTSVTAQEQVLAGIPLHAPLDLQFGPDGALYVNNYAGYRSSTAATGIVRIGYSGPCRPDEPKLEKPGGSAIARRGGASSGLRVAILAGPRPRIRVDTRGPVALEARDLGGRTVAAASLIGPGEAALDRDLAAGLYILEARSAAGGIRIPFAFPGSSR